MVAGPGEFVKTVKVELENAALKGVIPSEKLVDKEFASELMPRGL